jgi:hypothetical protein
VAPATPAVSARLPDVPLVPLSAALPRPARLRNCASGWALRERSAGRLSGPGPSPPGRRPLWLSDPAPPAGPRPESLSRTGATVAAGASAPSLIAQVESGRGLQGSLVLVVLRLGFGIRVKHLRLLA